MYDPAEDIMKRGKRIDADVEDLELTTNKVVKEQELNYSPTTEGDGSINTETQASDPFNITTEDIEALGPEDLSMDLGDDEQLKHRVTPVDFSGQDLDIPGAELDDAGENVGAEDEENNTYSLGGDNHNDLEEGR